mgnify:CR=1 FL=1
MSANPDEEKAAQDISDAVKLFLQEAGEYATVVTVHDLTVPGGVVFSVSGDQTEDDLRVIDAVYTPLQRWTEWV